METQTLHWQIDGEWITDLVRTWFWDEHRPYEKCRDLIGGCVQTDDYSIVDKITTEILEGRKKFVGINEFEYVDDNVNIRPMILKLIEREKNEDIAKIKLDIIANGIKYVDPYATCKSIRSANNKGIRTADECTEFFAYSEGEAWNAKLHGYGSTYPAYDTPTEAGLWLFNEPNTVYEASNHNELPLDSDEFWDNIYKITLNREGFEDRNRRYEVVRKMKHRNLAAEPTLHPKRGINENLEIGDIPQTDPSLASWSGLISPKGDFYPAPFGDHNGLAFYILNAFGSELGEQDKIFFDGGTPIWMGDIDDALPCLYRNGWISLRWLTGRGHYIEDKVTYGKINERWIPTKEQKDIVWEQIIRHELSSNIVPERYY